MYLSSPLGIKLTKSFKQFVKAENEKDGNPETGGEKEKASSPRPPSLKPEEDIKNSAVPEGEEHHDQTAPSPTSNNRAESLAPRASGREKDSPGLPTSTSSIQKAPTVVKNDEDTAPPPPPPPSGEAQPQENASGNDQATAGAAPEEKREEASSSPSPPAGGAAGGGGAAVEEVTNEESPAASAPPPPREVEAAAQ